MIRKSDNKAQNIHVNFKITQADKKNLVPMSIKSHLAINNKQNTRILLMMIFHKILNIGRLEDTIRINAQNSVSPTPVFINK
jgi:hypothetical protein